MRAQIPNNNRTKVGNGLRLHNRPKYGGPDMRSREGRRFTEVYTDIVSELGRKPTMSEQAQIRLAAALAIRTEDMSSRLATGKRVNAADLTQLSSELRRVLGQLGLGGAASPDAAQARRAEDAEAGLTAA
jgi:hypothetical protein